MNIINDENLTITKVAPLIRRRQLSPVELTKAFLTRIARLQPTLNAFITVTSDLALKQARQAEKEILRGRYRGALHGIPVSIKDLFYTAGIRTTAGLIPSRLAKSVKEISNSRTAQEQKRPRASCQAATKGVPISFTFLQKCLILKSEKIANG